MNMPAYIHHITTRVPEVSYSQDFARDYLKNCSGDPRTRRLIHAIYNRSGITKRHSVCGDFVEGAEATLFTTNAEGVMPSPTTAARNRVYAGASRGLAVGLARQILAEADGFAKSDITHIIFASCTGFANPGPDYHVILDLGLNPGVQRYTLGFMGCYAAFPALRMAAQFCEADPKAVVLVICLELCSLHMQINDKPDCILANSLFADGAAAAIVSARVPHEERPAYRMGNFASTLLPSGEADMAWEIGDEGFNIVLSSYVPDIIGANVNAILDRVLAAKGFDLADVEEWALHPGGRAILDKVETALSLPHEALACSRAVLRDYGNMSSATVLFVLKELMERADSAQATTLAMAFGPGLTVETAVMERIGGPVSRDDEEREPSVRFQPGFMEAALA
jgi:predicted naringenin-chalcone synthase